MEEQAFNAIIPIKIGGLVRLMMKDDILTFKEAVNKLYHSQLYELLVAEQTKVWHYSIWMLRTLLNKEMQTGKLELPDVV